jgi:hypothetical protein
MTLLQCCFVSIWFIINWQLYCNGAAYYFSCYIQVAGNENPSILICFASKTLNAGQVASKMHVIELGAQPGLIYSPLTSVIEVRAC